LVADIYRKIGVESVIEVKEGYSRETFVTYTEGLSLDRGWALPYFCTDFDSMKAEIEDAKILIFNGDLQTADQIAEHMRACRAVNQPLVIIANDISTGLMEQLAKLKMEGTFRVLACISPDFGRNRDLILEDLAIYTGGVEEIPALKQKAVLGSIKKITADKDKTVIVVENRETEKILERESQLSEQLELTEDKFEKIKIKKRLSNLKNAVAIISVGGNNEMEVKERKDRVDDSVEAVKSAIKGGYVAGGGATLYYISQQMKPIKKGWWRRFFEHFLDADILENLDGKELGYELLRQSIQKPFQQILLNANLSKESFSEILSEEQYGIGVNVKTRKIEDLLEQGIIDSALVVEVSLESAKNVANLVLQTDCLISGGGL